MLYIKWGNGIGGVSNSSRTPLGRTSAAGATTTSGFTKLRLRWNRSPDSIDSNCECLSLRLVVEVSDGDLVTGHPRPQFPVNLPACRAYLFVDGIYPLPAYKCADYLACPESHRGKGIGIGARPPQNLRKIIVDGYHLPVDIDSPDVVRAMRHIEVRSLGAFSDDDPVTDRPGPPVSESATQRPLFPGKLFVHLVYLVVGGMYPFIQLRVHHGDSVASLHGIISVAVCF